MSEAKIKEVGTLALLYYFYLGTFLIPLLILNNDCFPLQLKSDIDELNGLLKQAKRKRVQDLLSLEIRKLETEWITLKDNEQSPTEVASVPTTSAPVQNKRYQIKLNGYGK